MKGSEQYPKYDSCQEAKTNYSTEKINEKKPWDLLKPLSDACLFPDPGEGDP
jgi:hypothetical protein